MDSSRKIQVLLVDDEKAFVDALSKRLAIRDFDVCCVYHGADAVALIQREDYDVVLLDVLMPGKHGLDILKEIKDINPLIQIIMLTGHARVDSAIQGMERGAYDYLIKPAKTEELVEKIRLAYSHKVAETERMRRRQYAANPVQDGRVKKLFKSLSQFFQKDQPNEKKIRSDNQNKEKSNHSDGYGKG